MKRVAMAKIANLVKNELPENHGFIVFAFPFGTDGMYYASNAQREDVIKALHEFLYQHANKNYGTREIGD